MTDQTALRVRFAPSPTGDLHVGGARTALFNHLLARRTGGTFILRIEDTDAARNVAGADERIMRDLRWLGITWDEGVGVGGPHGPYYQTQRLDLYRAAVDRLLASGRAYHAFETPEELEAMRAAAAARKASLRYPRPACFPDAADVRRAREAGRPVVVRFTAPDEPVTVHDEVMGEVTVAAEELDDFIILKADGMPTYHLANVVDDGAMGVNLVMRGQEFLGQTPRHIALQRVLGLPTPRYAHLPLILDMQGRKLSKRDGDVEVHAFRVAGYLPEALVNFIALLGWSPGGQREKMTLPEMVELFSLDRIGRTNAKFDREKLLAFNTDALAGADPDRLAAAFDDWLSVADNPLSRAGVPAELRPALLRANRGMRTFQDIAVRCGFLFIRDDELTLDPQAVAEVLTRGDHAGWRMLEQVLAALEALKDWTPESIESLLKSFCAERGAGMGRVAQPLRVAVTGTTVSPAIFDTLALLGRERTLKRIRRALSARV